MISVRAALEIAVRDLPLLGSEYVALPQALGRVLSDPVSASRDVPPFRNAAMDGYAVRASDVATVSPDMPARLRILEVVGAGSVPRQTVAAGVRSQDHDRFTDAGRCRRGRAGGGHRGAG